MATKKPAPSGANPFLRGGDLAGTPLVIGHRGARGLAPENTLEAFALAFDQGAAMIELDVQLSRDRVPMVLHDTDLVRCTDVRRVFPGRAPWRVGDFTAKELGTLDAGAGFAPPAEGFLAPTPEEARKHLDEAALARFRSGTVRIPTLEAVLGMVVDRDRYVNVELKSLPLQDPDLGPAVLGLVRRMGVGDRVLFSSFDHELVRALKRAEPRVAAAVLASDRLVDPARYVTEVIGADGLHPCVTPHDDTLGLVRAPEHGTLLLADRVGALRAAGLLVNVWTVNDPALVPYLKEAGVTGIVTDFPARVSRPGRRARR